MEEGGSRPSAAAIEVCSDGSSSGDSSDEADGSKEAVSLGYGSIN